MEFLMDATIIHLAAGLAPALIKVIETLGEKTVIEPALKKGLGPFSEWLTSKYDQAKAEKDLHKALLNALDDLRAELDTDPYERLFATMKFTGLNAQAWGTLATAAVEMIHPNPDRISQNLLDTLGLENNKIDLLAKFLHYFRKHLADVDGYCFGIAYANDLDQHGLLIDISSHTERTADGINTLIEYFGITTDEDHVLGEYLQTLLEQIQYLPLPLSDPGAASHVDAELRQVFVPLTMRDLKAEEDARRQLERQTRRSDDLQMAVEAEASRSIRLGDILTRYKRFALIGGAGSGKTTLLKMAALAFIENQAAKDLGWTGEPLFPIFLRLRNFGAFLVDNANFSEPGPGALTAYLTHHFCQSYNLDLTTKFFDRHLRKGNCIILLDGLDEVSQGRADVALQVSAFIHHYGRKGNHFGLASRPRGFESVEEFLRPAGFAICDVNPLDPSGIRHLIGNVLAWIVNDPRQLIDDKKGLAEKILSSSSLTELASTPLFCTALTLVYKHHGSDLPQRRVDVIEQIIDLLLGFWKTQEPELAKRHELAHLDGTGENHIDTGIAVDNKRGRLSYLAYQMQIAGQKTEVDSETAIDWLQAHFVEEDGQDPETAKKWAQGFLRYAHEHSGLFVEQEGPGIFVFTHEGFREYLAARELLDLGETYLIDTIMKYIIDDSWEQVILLAAAYRRYSKKARQDIINLALDKTHNMRTAGDNNWLRCLTMSGRMARDMDKYLPTPKRKRVEDLLHSVMIDVVEPPTTRATAADVLDELGYLPPDLHSFILIPGISPETHIGKYPVTNAQYQRFLGAEDFGEREYWVDYPKFAEPDKNYDPLRTWEDEGWKWLQENWDENKKLYPRFWNDPQRGVARLGVPVVGISWYEANAYCKWLLTHWDDLEEGKQNPGWQPELVRLPIEAEWIAAAGGAKPRDRFPWDEKGKVAKDEAEIVRRANVGESGIGRTTPVGMYPLGVSPTGVWDLGGNVWEWQANYYGSDHDWLALRGGSFIYYQGSARLSYRSYLRPSIRWYDLGFRVVALRSAAEQPPKGDPS